MRSDKDWIGGDIEKKKLMTFFHLSTKEMKTERNYISQFGAVRMTKAEAIEIITKHQRYMNFWTYVT
eukprot:12889432-Heterocapsa_arctica.AAC.1